MKSYVKVAAAAVLAVSFLGGCAIGAKSLAQESHQSIQSKIVKGKTTKNDVLAMFGEPTQKMSRAGGEAWLYSLQETSLKTFVPLILSDNGTKSRNLEITFGKKDVVSDYEFAETKM